jgi:hypothetical protein
MNKTLNYSSIGTPVYAGAGKWAAGDAWSGLRKCSSLLRVNSTDCHERVGRPISGPIPGKLPLSRHDLLFQIGSRLPRCRPKRQGACSIRRGVENPTKILYDIKRHEGVFSPFFAGLLIGLTCGAGKDGSIRSPGTGPRNEPDVGTDFRSATWTAPVLHGVFQDQRRGPETCQGRPW